MDLGAPPTLLWHGWNQTKVGLKGGGGATIEYRAVANASDAGPAARAASEGARAECSAVHAGSAFALCGHPNLRSTSSSYRALGGDGGDRRYAIEATT